MALIRRLAAVFALIALVIAASPALFAEPATQPAANRVEDPGKHFAFDLPNGWTIQPPNRPNMVLMARSASEGEGDSFLENVNVVIVSLTGADAELTLEQMVPEVIAGLKQAITVKRQGELKKVTLGGENAITVDFTIESENVVVESKQTYVLLGDDFYVVTYTSQADTKPAMHESEAALMKTWAFLK